MGQLDTDIKIKHLYHRAGFGLDIHTWKKVIGKDPKTCAKKLMKQSLNKSHSSGLATFSDGINPLTFMEMSQQEKKEMQKMKRSKVKELNVNWINEMAKGDDALRQKMAFFWHDHFACRVNNPRLIQQQLRTLQSHSLGKFGDLLMAISKDPAMLLFLNNQQNRKGHPNENFAREVLELFTMGRGNYTEKDIQEAARAFTGWSTNRDGEFVFRRRIHDNGTKEFLGQRGNFKGEDIIRIILEQPQTAVYLTEKLYRFLVNPIVDEFKVEEWAESFFESEYDIAALLEKIFTSDHFYETKNIGVRIKSPVEFTVSLMKQLGLRFQDDDAPVFLQKLLGQVLLQPNSVAGWPEGKAWIDSSSLLARLQIPKMLIWSNEFAMQAKDSFAGNEDSVSLNRKQKRSLKAEIEWEVLIEALSKKEPRDSISATWAYFQQRKPAYFDQDLIKESLFGDNQMDRFKVLCMRILETPEYQFC